MIINDDTVQVKPGEIEVSTIERVLDLEDAKAWHVDLVSKYAVVGGYSVTGEGLRSHKVHLAAENYTLYVNKELQGTDTCICVEVPEDWIVFAESTRYTCRIVAYKPTYKDGN